jgi:uncharacterized protein YbjT (DUF2867 family)
VAVDLSGSPSFDAKAVLDFFDASGRNLVAAEAAAGVRHHVALSIVGADRVPDQGYYRAKVAQEKIIEVSGIPYTIVRSTQFLEFLGGIADASTSGGVVRVPPSLLQPVAADEVAALVSDIALGEPRNGIVELAGPERALQRDHRSQSKRRRRLARGRDRSGGTVFRRAAGRKIACPLGRGAPRRRQSRGVVAPRETGRLSVSAKSS